MKKSMGFDNSLFVEIKQLIQEAKQRAAVSVNIELTLLYWQVGKRISDEVLKNKRAEYGKKIILNLAQDLTLAFGRGSLSPLCRDFSGQNDYTKLSSMQNKSWKNENWKNKS